MLRTYQGYFNEGQFISKDNIPIPDKKRVIITILDEDADMSINNDSDNIPKRQLVAFNKFFRAIDKIDDGALTDDDYADLEQNRLNFRREFNI